MVTPQKNLLVVLWAILLLLISCEFELKNTYEPQRDTDRPPPEILINELSFQEDTIYAYRSQLLTFNFSTVDIEKILGVRILLDYQEYAFFSDSAGSVGFNYESLAPGPHQVDLEVYTTAETGSIADQLEQELYVFSTGWVLNIVRYYYELRSSVVDGVLQLDWDRYLASDFVDYGIEFGSSSQLYHVDDNTLLVPWHIGNATFYKIWAMTTSNINIQFGFNAFSGELPEIKRSLTDSGTYVIHWDKPKYYGVMEKIQLWEDVVFGDPPTHTLVKETSDFNDTLYHVNNIQNGQLRSYNLIMFGKYPPDPFQEQPATASVIADYTYYTQ